jgi:hypothetical protein
MTEVEQPTTKIELIENPAPPEPTQAAATRSLAIGARAYCDATDGTAIGPGARCTVDREVVDTVTDPIYYNFMLYVLMTRPYMRIPERVNFLSKVLGYSVEEIQQTFDGYDRNSAHLLTRPTLASDTPSEQPIYM